MNCKCWYCGSDLVWDNDFDLEDIEPCEIGESGIVSYLHCSNCNAEARFISRIKNKKE